MHRDESDPAHVVIAGGGFAALEAAVALRALAEDRVRITLISPDPGFRYRPAATAEVFRDDPPLVYDLARLAGGLGAGYEMDRLVGVAPRAKEVRLASGRRMSFDRLILCIGARSTAAIPGAFTFRDQRDVPRIRQMIDEVRRGEVSSLVFGVPSRHSWALPAYELALLARASLVELADRVEVALVTPEQKPLGVFGSDASDAVLALLHWFGVRFVGGATPHGVRREGMLELDFDAPIKAERVIAVPDARAQRIPGIPASWLGFIPTDSVGRVEGLNDVYAAGDLTTFPVKQGGLATQQADRVAHTIAGELGAPVHELHSRRVLQARLQGAGEQLLLRAELDEFGQPITSMAERLGRQVVEPKVHARYLGPFLAHHNPVGSLAA